MTMSNQSLKVKCPFCDVMFAAKYSFHQHLCDKHFKDNLSARLPTAAPLACPAQGCNYIAKDSRQSLIRHYGMTHKIVVDLLKEHVKGYDENESMYGGGDAPQQQQPQQLHIQESQTEQGFPSIPPPQHQQHSQQQQPYHPPLPGHPQQPQNPQHLPPGPSQGGLPPMTEFYPGYGPAGQQHLPPPQGAPPPPPHHGDYGQPHVPPPGSIPQQQQAPPPPPPPPQEMRFEQQQIDGTYDPSHYSDHSLDGKSMPSTPVKDGSVSSNSPTNLPPVTTSAPVTTTASTSATTNAATTSTAAAAAVPVLKQEPKQEPKLEPAEDVPPTPTPAEAVPPTPTPVAEASGGGGAAAAASPKPATSNPGGGRRLLSPPKVCEICGKTFDGKNRAMLKVQHMAQHFKEKLFADLPTKSPPYKCPIEGCPYETKHKPDWARHYGSVHKYLDKYLKEHLETNPPHPNFLNPPPRKLPEEKKEESKKPDKKAVKNADSKTGIGANEAPKKEVKVEEGQPSTSGDTGPKFSTFLPKDHLSKILNTAMTQQSQVGKDFGVITVGSGPGEQQQQQQQQQGRQQHPQPTIPDLKQEPKQEPMEVGSGIEPSANQLDLIDQVLSNTAKHEADPDSANPLSCFMCDEVTVFKSEDELNNHINTCHFDLAGDDDLAELTNDDLEASLDFFSDVQSSDQSSSVAAAVSSMASFTPAAAAATPSTSGSAPPSGSKLTLAERRSTGRPCEICGYEPKTKNKSRERQDHLAMKHYRPRIEEDLKEVTANNYKCPICDYMGKDKQTIYRHYTGKHKVVEKYLADDIAAGTVIPLAQKLVVTPVTAAIAALPPLPQQPTGPPQILPKNNGEQIMQVDGAFDLEDDDDDDDNDDDGVNGISQLDGTLEDDREEEAEQDVDSSFNDSSNAGGGASSSAGKGVIRAVCPLCGEETKMHRTYHLATRHFKVRHSAYLLSLN